MKQKILKWVYDESSNAYDLYFNPYNDSEPEPVATIAEDAGTWELANSLTCSNCFLNAESLEDAKNETMNLVKEYIIKRKLFKYKYPDYKFIET